MSDTELIFEKWIELSQPREKARQVLLDGTEVKFEIIPPYTPLFITRSNPDISFKQINLMNRQNVIIKYAQKITGQKDSELYTIQFKDLFNNLILRSISGKCLFPVVKESNAGSFPGDMNNPGNVLISNNKNIALRLMKKLKALTGEEQGTPAAQQSIIKTVPNKKVPPQHPPLENEHQGPSYGLGNM